MFTEQVLLLNLQKCHIGEAERCLSERKRKFMDTELAQDTEGKLIIASLTATFETRPYIHV